MNIEHLDALLTHYFSSIIELNHTIKDYKIWHRAKRVDSFWIIAFSGAGEEIYLTDYSRQPIPGRLQCRLSTVDCLSRGRNDI